MSNPLSIRGRPINPALQLQKKKQLMDAAYALLQQKSYRSISIREIAAHANMKSAMISYYFGDKETLFIKLLEHLADQQFEEFQNVLKDQNPVKAFISKAVVYFAKNTAITRLIADEVLFQDSAMGARFIELFPKRMAILLPNLIASQQQQGLFKQHLNPRWAAFSLMTLIIMPFIGSTVRLTAWEISDQDVSSDAWAEHIYGLFTSGIQQPAQLSE